MLANFDSFARQIVGKNLIGCLYRTGLSGFSVAHVLCKAGHSVRVLEKLSALGTPSGGLRVPPNMSKILKKWVGPEELAKTAVLNIATPWHDCMCKYFLPPLALTPLCEAVNTGERMGVAQWRPAVMAETGGDFLLMKVSLRHNRRSRVPRCLHSLIYFLLARRRSSDSVPFGGRLWGKS